MNNEFSTWFLSFLNRLYFVEVHYCRYKVVLRCRLGSNVEKGRSRASFARDTQFDNSYTPIAVIPTSLNRKIDL